jgi:Tfp pilus assembly protein PilN
MLRRQDSLHAWAIDKKTTDIAKERKELIAEANAVGEFLSSRVIWSNYLRDLPTRLPADVSLSKFSAECEYKKGGEGKAGKRSLSLMGATLFDKGRAAPEEIEAFMDSLRKVELLRKDFPKIELAEIRWRSKGDQETATFTVLATPKK